MHYKLSLLIQANLYVLRLSIYYFDIYWYSYFFRYVRISKTVQRIERSKIKNARLTKCAHNLLYSILRLV